MMKNKEEFEYSIPIPVPLGEKVWTFWTDCSAACEYQKRENKPIACARTSPCHTMKNVVQSKELTFGRLEDVLKWWNVFYFKTKEEAEEACDRRIKENIKKMRELGYAVDSEGYANHILTAEEARIFNMKFE